MTDDADYPLADAWDRIGEYGQSISSLFGRIDKRNLNLWMSVGTNLRQSTVGTDALAASLGKVMLAMQANLEDVWRTATEPVNPQPEATVLPTVLLRFQRATDSTYRVPSPVSIPVPSGRDDTQGPARVAIGVGVPLPSTTPLRGSGQSETTSSDDLSAGTAALNSCVTVVLTPGGSSYLLSAQGMPPQTDQTASGTDVITGLQSGYYQGIVYLTGPTLPLASLRIIVE